VESFGEAADDVTSLSVNYLLYSIQKYGKLAREFKTLFDSFMRNYLQETQDHELLEVIQPFLCFQRACCGKPHLVSEHRSAGATRAVQLRANVLEVETFDYRNVNALLKD